MGNTMTIYDTFKNYGFTKYKKYDGEFGIEIETETKDPYDAPSFTYWSVHQDGSLRDFGQEYVLKQPVKYEYALPEALAEFEKRTAKIPFIKDSLSTSVHVHVNMLNESFKTMGNFLTLYSLLENILIRYSGPDRLSNLFCLPICDAEITYHNIISMMKHAETKSYKSMMMNENHVKYAACNLSSFNQFGSIELRSFRGETDIKSIQDWVDIIYRILQYSRKDISPRNILADWKSKEIKILDDIFSKNIRKSLSHKEELKLIEQNIWYAANIAYSVKDWELLDTPVKLPEFKPKQKELDAAAIRIFGALNFQSLDEVQSNEVLFYLRKEFNKKHGLMTEFIQKSEPVELRPRAPAINRGGLQNNPFNEQPVPQPMGGDPWGNLINPAAGEIVDWAEVDRQQEAQRIRNRAEDILRRQRNGDRA